MNDSIKINEMFYSLQGEGRFVGVPSVFIRLAGCPLRCRWCDTKYAWSDDGGRSYSFEQIVKFIEQYPCGHTVITGGEPMLNPLLASFCDMVKNLEMLITVETSGVEFVGDLKCDLMSISPKLSNSIPCEKALAEEHKKCMLNKDALKRLMRAYDYQLKFVVDTPADLDEIAELAEEIQPNPDKVYLMPQAVDKQTYLEKIQWLSEVCKSSGFNLGQRLQVLLWDGKRGK